MNKSRFLWFSVFLVGCGDLSHGVNQARAYQRGGCIPGHIYRLKTEAIVVTKAGSEHPVLSLVREDDLSRQVPEEIHIKWHTEWRVPAGSRVRVDSIYHRLEVAITEDNWLLVYGTILDGRHEKLRVEIDYGFIFPDGPRPLIPTIDARYLQDVTSDASQAHD